MIKIEFEFETPYGKFRDALYLAEDHQYTQAEIVAMQNERLSNWIQNVENPPRLDIVELDGITYQKTTIDGQIILTPLEG